MGIYHYRAHPWMHIWKHQSYGVGSCEGEETQPSCKNSEYSRNRHQHFTWETTLSITPPESPEAPRAGASESSSSKNITHGRAALAWNDASQNRSNVAQYFVGVVVSVKLSPKKAIKPFTFWKMSLTFFSDSPMYMLISSGPFTLRKFKEHSVATAFANNVWGFKWLAKVSCTGQKFGIIFSTTNLLFQSLADHKEELLIVYAIQMKINPYAIEEAADYIQKNNINLKITE